MLFLGIDLGTQGTRGIVCDERGKVFAQGTCNFGSLNTSCKEGQYEQAPIMWWNAVKQVITECMDSLLQTGRKPSQIRAITIDGTSGTIVLLDKEKRPLRDALLYNDMRAAAQAEKIHRYAGELEKKMGYLFNASFALPKVLWIKEEEPYVYEKARHMVHQSDYIVGMLTGEYGVTDYSNALKSGFDLKEEEWPKLLDVLGLDRTIFPSVIPPGQGIGTITKRAAVEFGLSTDTVVAAGATDGYVSAISTGAVRRGDWASVIGTTMVLKGVTEKLLCDAGGSSYSHKLPSGDWMFGGASNIGGRCLNDSFDKEQFEMWNRGVMDVIPTKVISYPLHGRGERFPFLDPEAKAFVLGDISDPQIHYAALMEGVAYAERFALEHMQHCGAAVGNEIYTTGGACSSSEWLQIRASVLDRVLKVPEHTGAAIGCAILAASASCYGSLTEAAGHMVSYRKIIEPVHRLTAAYDQLYQRAFQAYKERYRVTVR